MMEELTALHQSLTTDSNALGGTLFVLQEKIILNQCNLRCQFLNNTFYAKDKAVLNF